MSFNKANYQKILNFIRNSNEFYQNTITPSIVAVTKTQPESAILEAIKAGIRVFGENRVQEALIKYKNIKVQPMGRTGFLDLFNSKEKANYIVCL